jgi:hypothetical protein
MTLGDNERSAEVQSRLEPEDQADLTESGDHGDESFVDRRSPGPPRNFPGGAARLPRLNRPSDDVPEFVAPLRQNPEERSPEKDRGFEAYYSTDSLFSSSRTRESSAESRNHARSSVSPSRQAGKPSQGAPPLVAPCTRRYGSEDQIAKP